MKKQLQEISNKSQAESVDLWPEIYAELKETKAMKNPPRIHVALSRIAAVVSLLFLGVAVVFAISQIYVDSGLEGERAERLVTQINESITHGDITIRLDWVYADVKRVSVGYTLLDTEGNVFVPEQSRYFYSFELYARPIVEFEARGFRPAMLLLEADSSPYNMSNSQQIMTWRPYFDYGFSSYDLIENPAMEGAVIELDIRISLRNSGELYRFLAEVPVYPAQFEIDALVMHGDTLDLTLRELTITQTMTTIVFCYQIPDVSILEWNNDDFAFWEATEFRLYFDNQNINALYPEVVGEFMHVATWQDEFCEMINWAIPSDVLPQTIRFEVQELRESRNGSYSEEQAEFLAEQYGARGIRYELNGPYNEAAGYSVWPTGLYELAVLENQEIYNEVMALFYEQFPEIPRIVGPWEIEFELTEPSG
jgi:hypothetical protein